MRVDFSIRPFPAGFPAVYRGKGAFSADAGSERVFQGGAPPPGDRFEPSRPAPALLGARGLLGTAESLPGQGTREVQAGEGVSAAGRTPVCAICGGTHGTGAHTPDAIGAASGRTSPAPLTEESKQPNAGAAGPAGKAAGTVQAADDAENGDGGGAAGKGDGGEAGGGPVELTEEEQAEVKRLQERDREVRTHEHAHMAAGGHYVRGVAHYEYSSGPDGRRYAVGGEVSIETSPVPGDPQATIRKAQVVRRAALAPAHPSTADYHAAAAASRMESGARQELARARMEGNGAEGDRAAEASKGTQKGAGKAAGTEFSQNAGEGRDVAAPPDLKVAAGSPLAADAQEDSGRTPGAGGAQASNATPGAKNGAGSPFTEGAAGGLEGIAQGERSGGGVKQKENSGVQDASLPRPSVPRRTRLDHSPPRLGLAVDVYR